MLFSDKNKESQAGSDGDDFLLYCLWWALSLQALLSGQDCV